MPFLYSATMPLSMIPMVHLFTMNPTISQGRVGDHHYAPYIPIIYNISLTKNSTGVNTPRAQSPSRPSLQRRASSQPPPTTKTVQFALDTPPSSRPSSPKQIRQRRQHASSSKHSQHDDYDSEDGSSSRKDKSRARRRRHRRSSSDDPSRSSSPAESDSTVELPERFDERGRPLAQQDDDPVAHIEELFGGRGSVGRLLQNFGLGGGSDDGDRNRDRDRRGRRRR